MWWTKHKRCARCLEIGHHKEMVRHREISWYGTNCTTWVDWYHKDCFIKEFNVKEVKTFYGVKVWIKKKKKRQ